MATKPAYVSMTNSSIDVLNAIRNDASVDYKNYVPIATNDNGTIKAIGRTIMDYPNIANEFVSALVNRIAKVLITSKLFYNPWEAFKKGKVDIGESIEDVFIDLAKPFEYDPELAETTVFKREAPNVHSAFYVCNYQKYYKQTIEEEQLSKAFLSLSGVTDFIAGLVDQMYSAAAYDEFQTMKYMLAVNIVKGRFPITKVSAPSGDTIDSIVALIKGDSNAMEFKSTKYNPAGVANEAGKNEQYLISTATFNAQMDVMSLAKAFNMDKAEFLGHSIMVDSFSTFDTDRIKALLGDNPEYYELTASDLTALGAIQAVIVDSDFFMVFDRVDKFTEIYNGQGLYWNYFYHVWKIFAISPFANRVAFSTTDTAVSSVTVSPATVTVSPGGEVSFTATVTTTGFAPKTVTWSSNNDNVTIDSAGNAKVNSSASGSATITATSTVDSTKKKTATITIS